MPRVYLDFIGSHPSQEKKMLQQIADDKFAFKPTFTLPDKLKKPDAYKRFLNQDSKEQFRNKLFHALAHQWAEQFGSEQSKIMQQLFLQAVEMTDESGAMIFADLISRRAFSKLVTQYDHILEEFGNKSWLHSYVNLGNHPDFLNDQTFSKAFLHPLLIAVIAYQIGGAIRIVDARAKNAEPISIKAQDNMLHIDNTPFNDEYKIIVTWEKHQVSGPKGQNFVIIPGTHKGVRDCFVNHEEAFSTENGSIFINEQSVQQVFDIQQQVLGNAAPLVVEVTDRECPLTTLFAAGSLVHHRYRTENGFSRSCMILAFHRAGDNPGQFIDSLHLQGLDNLSSLNHLLFGLQNANSDVQFINALTEEAGAIFAKLSEIKSELPEATKVIAPKSRELSEAEFAEWKRTVTTAPTIEDMKTQKLCFPVGAKLEPEQYITIIKNIMMMDKHGPLDLILYHDSHEEIRKWGRNRIREMNENALIQHLTKWQDKLTQPKLAQIIPPKIMAEHTNTLIKALDRAASKQLFTAQLDAIEKISPQDAVRSIRQLMIDLGEAIVRCDSAQTYLSTSLFIFWALDEAIRLYPVLQKDLEEMGCTLLAHYVSTSLLVQKQILNELKPANCDRLRVSELSIFARVQQPASNNHCEPQIKLMEIDMK